MVDPALVLGVLTKLSSPSPSPSMKLEETAKAIAHHASRSPIHGLNEEKTAAILISIAKFESDFIADAEGDCMTPAKLLVASKSGRCPSGSKPHSFCLMQIGESNFASLGVTREEIQTDVGKCVETGLRLIEISFRTCSHKPLEERLRHYAGGGPVCTDNEDAKTKSVHRMKKAIWIFSKYVFKSAS